MDMYLIGIRTDKCKESSPHGDSAGICIGQTKDVTGQNVRIQEYFPDTGCQDLCFTCSGPGNNHDRAFRCIYGKTLLLI